MWNYIQISLNSTKNKNEDLLVVFFSLLPAHHICGCDSVWFPLVFLLRFLPFLGCLIFLFSCSSGWVFVRFQTVVFVCLLASVLVLLLRTIQLFFCLYPVLILMYLLNFLVFFPSSRLMLRYRFFFVFKYVWVSFSHFILFPICLILIYSSVDPICNNFQSE